MPVYPDVTRSTVSSRAHGVVHLARNLTRTQSVHLRPRPRSQPRRSLATADKIQQRLHFATSLSLRASSGTVTIRKDDFDEIISLMKDLSDQLKCVEQDKAEVAAALKRLQKDYYRAPKSMDENDCSSRTDPSVERDRRPGTGHPLNASDCSRDPRSSYSQSDLLRENKWMRELLWQNAEVLRNLKRVCEELKRSKTDVETTSIAEELLRLKQRTEGLLKEVIAIRETKDVVDGDDQTSALQKSYDDLRSRHMYTIRVLEYAKQDIHDLKSQLTNYTKQPVARPDVAEVRILESLYDALAEARVEARQCCQPPVDGDKEFTPDNTDPIFGHLLRQMNTCFESTCGSAIVKTDKREFRSMKWHSAKTSGRDAKCHANAM